MVREARRAGLHFDELKLRALNCVPDDEPTILHPVTGKARTSIPQIEISSMAAPDSVTPLVEAQGSTGVGDQEKFVSAHEGQQINVFEDTLRKATVHGRIHDVLLFNHGVSRLTTLSWLMLEYLPFRRMDLQPDGSWKSITWPLPKGEVRDLPENAVIHNSVIRRMKEDSTYRPGNLIVGGGGRGTRTAPVEYGIGKWKIAREKGDLVGEVWVRDGPPGPIDNQSPNGKAAV